MTNLALVLPQAFQMYANTKALLPWISDAVWFCLDARCEWRKAHRMSRLVLDAAAEHNDARLAACGELLHGRSQACVGNYDAAVTHLERALDALRIMDNQPATVMALNGLGVVYERRGEPAVALVKLVEARAIADRYNMVSVAPSVLANMVVSYLSLGWNARAIALAEQAVYMSRAVGDLVLLTTSLINLAAARCASGDYAGAIRSADEAHTMSREIGDRRQEYETLIVRAEAKLRGGWLREAYEDTELVLSMVDTGGHRYFAGSALRQRSRILTAMGRAGEAAHVDSVANAELAGLTECFRDPTIELLTHRRASESRNIASWQALPGGAAAEAALDGAFDEGRDPG